MIALQRSNQKLTKNELKKGKALLASHALSKPQSKWAKYLPSIDWKAVGLCVVTVIMAAGKKLALKTFRYLRARSRGLTFYIVGVTALLCVTYVCGSLLVDMIGPVSQIVADL